MTAKVLDGKAISQAERNRIAQCVKERSQQGQRPPGLAVILIGEDPASHIYVRRKQLACEEVGFYSESHRYDASTSPEIVLEKIEALNEAPHIDGILIQLPLPPHFPTDHILSQIAPHKDVDGFHAYNLGRLLQDQPGLRPCTPAGILQLLSHTDLMLQGAHACMVGASRIVGRPMAVALLNQGATVTICHAFTRHLSHHIQEADLLIVAIGDPQFIQGAWIKEGATVIDVGINRTVEGKVVGDVHFEEAKKKAGWITPVPGGVGPMTICALLGNTLLANQMSTTTPDLLL